MANLKRKLKRNNNLRLKKSAKKQIKNIENTINSLPKTCRFCEKKFRIKEDASTWMIEAFPDKINLICPTCYEEIRSDS